MPTRPDLPHPRTRATPRRSTLADHEAHRLTTALTGRGTPHTARRLLTRFRWPGIGHDLGHRLATVDDVHGHRIIVSTDDTVVRPRAGARPGPAVPTQRVDLTPDATDVLTYALKTARALTAGRSTWRFRRRR